MPTYDFQNIKTKRIFTKIMSIAAKEKYLADNPNIKQVILSAPALTSGVNHNSKLDNGWKENMQRIAEAHPDSPLAEKVGGRATKKLKTKDVLKKHRLEQKTNYRMPFEKEKRK